jgi:hypothetical protein
LPALPVRLPHRESKATCSPLLRASLLAFCDSAACPSPKSLTCWATTRRPQDIGPS